MKQLSPDEKNFIFQIANRIRYPIVRLELRSSKERSLISTALNHVHLKISYKVFITVQSDYAIYEVSDIFLLLHQLVEQGKKNPDYLFDIPYIKRGQVMLTEMGKSYVAQDNLNR